MVKGPGKDQLREKWKDLTAFGLWRAMWKVMCNQPFTSDQPCQLWCFPVKSSGCIQVSPVVPIKSFITKESSLELAVATHCFSFGGGGCTGSSLLHTGFLQLWQVGATPCCAGFSWQPLTLLQSTGSSCPAACGIFPEPCGIFPEPGIKPVSPTLAGRFLTTEPPEKSCYFP